MKIGMVNGALRAAGDDLFRVAREIGLDGVELSIQGEYPHDWIWDPAARRRVKGRADEAGVAIASALLSTVGRLDFPEDAARRALGREMSQATARACAELGIPLFMIPCFKQHNYTTVAQVERAIADLRLLAPLAEDLGVTLGLETLLPAGANCWLLDAVGSPAVRLYYDAANSLRYGWDPFQEIPDLASYICQHHIKPANPPAALPLPPGGAPNPPMRLGEGTMDLPALIRSIRLGGFDGWLVLETKPVGDDPVADARHNVRTLREWLGR